MEPVSDLRNQDHGALWRHRGLVAAVAGLLLLGGLEVGRRIGDVAAGSRSVTRDAQWVWAPDGEDRDRPRAFFLARDFELDAIPGNAHIVVLGEEEYVLFLNGQRIGSNRYHEGAVPDRIPVTGALKEGMNRIVAELRSTRGVGGFLACVDTGEDSCAVATDGSWQVVARYREALLKGWRPLSTGARVRVWGRPPVGHWGRLEKSRERFPFQALLGELGVRQVPASAVGRRSFLEDGQVQSVFDFGSTVKGYLEVEFLQDGPDLAVAFWGPEPIKPDRRQPTAPILGVPGQRVWRAVRPVSLRYLTIIGPTSARKAWIDPVQDDVAGDLLDPLPPPDTLFGLHPWWVAKGAGAATHSSTK